MLSPSAEQCINEYLNLPFKGITGVRCPYFNNAKYGKRAELRALIGKGSPQEIVDEAKIISLQYHTGLFDKNGKCCLHNEHTGQKTTTEDIRKFLIDRHLGIECSGFVTHVLSCHFRETKKVILTKKLKICARQKLLRRLICRLRPVENIGVTTYADDANTSIIQSEQTIPDFSHIQAGDIIVLLGAGIRHTYNHIILITKASPDILHYAHARAWKSEGIYGHGVARGTITITEPNKNILAQRWEECGKTNSENETYTEAREAKTWEIRRLTI